ncbi:MAG: rhodanese-related sulfurtransferase [Bacteroidetes bacterium]|nr:rhodanese-related sulfurtransferase [Bacteroidota bacterium]
MKKVQLHNRIDKRVLKARMQQYPEQRVTLSFYQYHRIEDPAAFRDELFAKWFPLGVLGRIYVASEGINAQLSMPSSNKDPFIDSINEISFLKGIRLNWAIEDNGKSFFVLKIQVKRKVLADGLDDETFDVTNSGRHLNAAEFNQLTDDPQTVIVDMRNHYESEVGHFEGAICPDVDTFRQSLPIVERLLEGKQDRNIVMYCTGGIRCEKASAWFKHRGFTHVHQLNGGIIEYARQAKDQGLVNKFHGKNFVFDERLGERISSEIISHCHQCGKPCDTHTNCRNEGCHLLFIQCPECSVKFDGCCSEECREIIHRPTEEQKLYRKGRAQARLVYKKGRANHLKKVSLEE